MMKRVLNATKRIIIFLDVCIVIITLKLNMPITAFDIEIMEGIKDIIDKDISVHHPIGYLAEKAGMSESRLKLLYKVVFKTGLYSYLLQKRMVIAGNLLQEGGKTLSQISKQTGFKHPTNFNRSFKNYYGLTPGKYRKGSRRNKL